MMPNDLDPARLGHFRRLAKRFLATFGPRGDDDVARFAVGELHPIDDDDVEDVDDFDAADDDDDDIRDDLFNDDDDDSIDADAKARFVVAAARGIAGPTPSPAKPDELTIERAVSAHLAGRALNAEARLAPFVAAAKAEAELASSRVKLVRALLVTPAGREALAAKGLLLDPMAVQMSPTQLESILRRSPEGIAFLTAN